MVTLISDNCSTNKTFALRVGLCLFICYIYRYNLALCNVIPLSSGTVDSVCDWMHKLLYQIPAAHLRQLISLKVKVDNCTGWSSPSEMLKRYLEIHEQLTGLGRPEIHDLILAGANHEQEAGLCRKLDDFDFVTKKLQTLKISLSDTRTLFEGVID